METLKAFPELNTPRLHLRQIVATDLPQVFEGLSRPEMIKYYGISYESLEATKAQMDWYDWLWVNKTGIWWAICVHEKRDLMIGAVGIYKWDHQHRNAEIGYWLLNEYQGIGYMYEAVRLAIKYLFSQAGLHRIYAFVEPENTPSLLLLKKLGFTEEGRKRQTEIKNGTYIDLIMFGLLENELPE